MLCPDFCLNRRTWLRAQPAVVCIGGPAQRAAGKAQLNQSQSLGSSTANYVFSWLACEVHSRACSTFLPKEGFHVRRLGKEPCRKWLCAERLRRFCRLGALFVAPLHASRWLHWRQTPGNPATNMPGCAVVIFLVSTADSDKNLGSDMPPHLQRWQISFLRMPRKAHSYCNLSLKGYNTG